MNSSEVGMQTQAEAPAPVRRVLLGPRPWTQLSTDCSPDFITKPASVENLPGEPFTVAKEAPTVDFAVYPERINPIVANPPEWTVWGAGCIGPDGYFYSAMGDHGGPDGETIIYQLDPKQKAIRRVLSFQALMGHKPGDWGYGKIHGHLCADEEGWIYFVGFWGGRPQEKDLNERYVGGVIARYNIYTGLAEHFGSPVPAVAFPMVETDMERGLMYLLGAPKDGFACYDLKRRQLKYYGGQGIALGAALGGAPIMDTKQGVAYFCIRSLEGPGLGKYDPVSNTVSLTSTLIPGDPSIKYPISAVTDGRAADGWFYCMTFDGGLFRFNTETEEVEDRGWNFGEGIFTFGPMSLSPGGRYIYYALDANGMVWKVGTPIVQYDTQTRQRKVLAFLAPYYESKYNYRFGGHLGMSISLDGSTLFLPMNGNALEAAGDGGAFGLPSLVVVHIPESERQE